MKILAINSSPRKGNTEFLLDSIAKRLDLEIIQLRKKKVHYCAGGDDCCPKTGKCDIKDDMEDIYERLESADIIILASPCYFFNVTARMKTFMDRCNPYYFNKKLKDKKFFLISIGGYEKSIAGAITAMENFVNGVHGKVIGSYTFVADKRDELKKKGIDKDIDKIVEMIHKQTQ